MAKLSYTLIFDYPTVAAICGCVPPQLGPASATGGAVALAIVLGVLSEIPRLEIQCVEMGLWLAAEVMGAAGGDAEVPPVGAGMDSLEAAKFCSHLSGQPTGVVLHISVGKAEMLSETVRRMTFDELRASALGRRAPPGQTGIGPAWLSNSGMNPKRASCQASSGRSASSRSACISHSACRNRSA